MKNVLLTLGLFAACTLLGCVDKAAPEATPQANQTHDDHDHDHDHDHGGHEEGAHGHPESFDAAVTDIVAKRDAIKTALEADDLKQADGPVHEIGHVLGELEALATKQGLDGDKLKTVQSARDALFGAFAELDKTIHGKTDGKSWKDVAVEIDAAVSQLQTLVTAATTTEEAPSTGAAPSTEAVSPEKAAS